MEQVKRGRGAPSGSQNAKKEIVAESFLHIRCRQDDKSGWVKAAQGAGGLSAWVVKTLNEKATTDTSHQDR